MPLYVRVGPLHAPIFCELVRFQPVTVLHALPPTPRHPDRYIGTSNRQAPCFHATAQDTRGQNPSKHQQIRRFWHVPYSRCPLLFLRRPKVPQKSPLTLLVRVRKPRAPIPDSPPQEPEDIGKDVTNGRSRQ